MAFAKLHQCRFENGAYFKGEPASFNPDFVVAFWPRKMKLHGTERSYTTLRLHGDETYQDWTLIWESPEEVEAALTLKDRGDQSDG